METTNYYKVGGSLTHNHRTYVVRQADCQLLNFLKAGEYCFVLNSRQMGKSSLRVRTGKKLRSEGFRCVSIDLTLIGSYVSAEKWYKGIAYQILDGLELDTELDFNTWWQQHEHLTDLQRFQQLIESVILVKISQSIVIFLDEIDSLIKINFKDDFFAFLRACYNQRSEKPDYNRLIFCLLGVASPADLIQDKGRTPFNIGKSIELTGFTFAEAKDALLPGLKEKLESPEIILQQVLNWTGGQPFLTQKLCSLIVNFADKSCSDIKYLVEDYVIKNWEAVDEPEHLRTIRNRLLIDEIKTIGILGLYQRILSNQAGIIADESEEQTALRLSGLVVKKNNTLQVYNLIYQTVFNWDWITHQLTHLRPYSEAINRWLKSDNNSSYLLQGQTLNNALNWSADKYLSNEDYQFLAASQAEQDRKINQILTSANEKSKQIIRRGVIILFTTSLTSVFIALITSIYAQEQIRDYRETIRIEKTATNSLKLFESKQIDGLVSAIQAGQELKALVTDESLDKYSTTKPFDALLNSLTQISEQNQLRGHKAGIKTVIFSPDGELIVSGSDDGTIKLWQRDGTLIKTLSNVSNVFSVRFSPDGKILASGSNDGTIKLWQRDGKLLKTLTRNDSIYTFNFSPEAEILASGGRDGKIKLWSSNGKLIQTINGHIGSIYSISFSPNGEMIASGSNDGTIKLFRRDGMLINTLVEHQGSVNTLSFSPDGKIIASGSNDNTVKLWNLKGKLIKTLNGHNAEINSINFSPDGTIIASGSGDKTIKLWKSDGTLIKTLSGHNDSVMSVNFSPDKKEIASASLDATIKLWNLIDTPIPRFKRHQNIVTSISFSPDGTKIVSSSLDKTIKLWNLEGEIVKTFKSDGKWIYFVSFSADGKTLAAVTSDGVVELRQEDGELIQTLADPQGDVTRVSFSPDGLTLATGSSNHSVKLWSKDGKLRKTLTGHNSDVTSINYSPDEKILASGGSDGSIKLWRDDGTLIQTRTGHNGQVTQISFSRDGKEFASSSEDGTVKLWKIDGTEIATFSGHNQGVTSVSFHPNGKILASSSSDGMINLWKSDGTLLFSVVVGNQVTGVAFSPNGQTLVAGSSDGSVILWSLNLDNLLRRGCSWLKDYLVHHPQPTVCLK
ncbi:AAA-like domain-containing protein [Fischerella sp. PCC 9605]|uniref:WD40 domain-containing protein n=1 Tax=Fischerella sp. PCC 9605 TaxID=1173024 RepID=UPI00047AD181|nr:AAA-like domain-containing protein [Fischerella sp. PCC 9605]